ncbi:MAG: hypothetical protein MJ175_03590 [Clostridia bacterium]|nr:hypothetical protein [Clostridia bacterium]
MIVPRYDISGLGVSNVLGVNQRFKTSIADQTSATHHYDPRLYIYNGAEISDDGKVMTVFYKINKACFIQEYLYDFGLPICFELSDFTVPRAEILDVALEGGRYGSFTLDRASGILTYTPEQTLDNIEILTIYIKYLGFAPQVFHVGVFPATNIYYEEGFADGLSGGTMGSVGQENHLVGDGRYNSGIVYGNDVAYMRFYDDDSIPMMPDTDGVLSDTASFTFFGSGVDVYAVCTAETGSVQMTVYDTDHNAVAAVLADTVLDPVYAALVGGTERSVRIAEIRDLPRGSYTLEMESVSAAPVRIDGFRVYGVIANIVENAYLEDKEDRRIDISFADFTPSYLDSSEENQVPGENAILAVTGWDMTNNMGLMTGAPNGDIRLAPGQALTLHISAEGNIRLMARSMGGEAAVIVNNGFAVICSETTMFYDPDLWYDDTDTPVTIYNIGPGMLVLSGITFCEDLHAGLMPLEAADTAAALAMCTEPEDPDVGGEEPDVPEIPMETRTLVVSLVDYRNNTVGTVNLEKNVIAGQRCTFYAAEISNAVSQNLPSKYALYEDEVFRSVIVRADETGSVTYHVGKVAELKIVVNAPGVSLSKLTQQIFYLRAIQKTSAKSCTFTTAQIKAAVGDYRVTVAYNVSVNYGSTQTLTLMAR